MSAMTQAKAEGEATMRILCDAGDYGAAATLGLELYGPELLGFLHARDEHEADACEAFAVFSEDMWRGLPRFSWRSSFRTWAYVVARRAYLRVRRDSYRRKAVPITGVSQIDELVDAVRTRTLPYLRTEVKSEVRRLRAALDADDRDMLTLRIDRGMSWSEIAGVMLGDLEATDEALAKEAARLRKRYERVKVQLRELMHAQERSAG